MYGLNGPNIANLGNAVKPSSDKACTARRKSLQRTAASPNDDMIASGIATADTQDTDTLDGSAGADVLFGRLVTEICFRGGKMEDPLDEVLLS